MPSPDSASSNIAEGEYAKKQLFTKSWLINWSHGSRFKLAVDLAEMFAGTQLLDYGCGDGTFLAMIMACRHRPTAAVGAEVSDQQVADCRTNHTTADLSFVRIAELERPEYAHRFDGLVCMEVLEHVVDLDGMLDSWRRLLAPGAKLLISVPVETGPILAGKQLMRRIAGWRGIGDYPGLSPYTWSEFSRSLVAGRQQHMPRLVHKMPDGGAYHCHKGFNWRTLRTALAAKFTLERQLSSPLRFLPTGWGSQAWFVLRNDAPA